jgi:hypothetical protein
MAVNLSAVQFNQPELVATVAHVLATTGLPPHTLQLEITESVLMQDAPGAVKILRALNTLGTRLSIDDFGTGYSSLSRLKRFPVNVLKIDRSFVDGLGEDPEDSAIVEAIIGLARALNLTTVAEGVETTRQMDHLVKLGCRFAQGFLLARPAPAAEMESLIERQGMPSPQNASRTQRSVSSTHASDRAHDDPPDGSQVRCAPTAQHDETDEKGHPDDRGQAACDGSLGVGLRRSDADGVDGFEALHLPVHATPEHLDRVRRVRRGGHDEGEVHSDVLAVRA